MSREAATALRCDELLSPLRGLDVFLLAILRADARSYVLPSLRDYRRVQLLGLVCPQKRKTQNPPKTLTLTISALNRAMQSASPAVRRRVFGLHPLSVIK